MSELLVPLTTNGTPSNIHRTIVGRVTRTPLTNNRNDMVLVIDTLDDGIDYSNYAAVITSQLVTKLIASPLVHSTQQTAHVIDGDILSVNQLGFIRTLYRVKSTNNVIFATDRCNSNCLMCSQPPKKIDDSEKIQENLKLISLIEQPPEFIGISGGEPTLLKEGLFEIMAALKDRLPNTFVNMLTNGRMFYYDDFCEKYAAVQHPHFRAAIPVYSDIAEYHDHVVQSDGAFVQTMRGLYNLGALGQLVEIRVVLHKLTYRRLPELARFIYSNIPFASHVALMGLEIMGYVRKNFDMLWIDPIEYQDELYEAVKFLDSVGMKVSIYNSQLCVLRKELWPFARKSISDFKNIYLDECEKCDVKATCGGLFKSAHTIHSKHIRAIPPMSLIENRNPLISGR